MEKEYNYIDTAERPALPVHNAQETHARLADGDERSSRKGPGSKKTPWRSPLTKTQAKHDTLHACYAYS